MINSPIHLKIILPWVLLCARLCWALGRDCWKGHILCLWELPRETGDTNSTQQDACPAVGHEPGGRRAREGLQWSWHLRWGSNRRQEEGSPSWKERKRVSAESIWQQIRCEQGCREGVRKGGVSHYHLTIWLVIQMHWIRPCRAWRPPQSSYFDSLWDLTWIKPSSAFQFISAPSPVSRKPTQCPFLSPTFAGTGVPTSTVLTPCRLSPVLSIPQAHIQCHVLPNPTPSPCPSSSTVSLTKHLPPPHPVLSSFPPHSPSQSSAEDQAGTDKC